MKIFRTMDIAASGLTAERLRLDIIANNLANAQTTRTADGGPYRRQVAVFAAGMNGGARPGGGLNQTGVRVVAIGEDPSPPRPVYDPYHLDANEEGYVLYPDIHVVQEMVDMIMANRAYDANISVLQAAKAMAMRALEIGR